MVAAELAGHGLIVSPTSRSAIGADLLVTNDKCDKAFSVQVKTNAKVSNSWLTGEKAQNISAPSHIYVFVNLDKGGKHEFFVVPSKFVAANVKVSDRKTSIWYSFSKEMAGKFRSKWSVLGAEVDGEVSSA